MFRGNNKVASNFLGGKFDMDKFGDSKALYDFMQLLKKKDLIGMQLLVPFATVSQGLTQFCNSRIQETVVEMKKARATSLNLF